MRIIGLTGGVASGKSTVAAMLREQGAVLVDADALTRELQAAGQPALSEITQRFGADLLLPDGTLDRARLADLVFTDAEARADLEAIVHPRVRQRIAESVADAMRNGAELVVVDIPLLFEGGGDEPFEGVLLVYAPAEVQVRRLVERMGISEAQARQRVAAQMPIEEKRRRATWVIDNSGSLDDTVREVRAWWSDVAARPR